MQKMGILFLSLVVLFFFFAGFYGFVVPANKASVNQYGFHILEQLETAIQNKIDADLEMYASNLEEVFNADRDNVPDRVKRRLNALGVDSLLDLRPAPPETPGAATKKADTAMSRKAKNPIGRQHIQGTLADIANGRLIYEFKLKRRTVVLTQPISRLMGDLGHAYPSDFYSAFIFLKCDSNFATTLYKSDGVPIGLKIATDSLLVNSKGAFYPGVTNLQTGGQDFKLFYVPLTKGKLQFALCGIKDADAYNQSLHRVPTGFVYPVVILLILLAIALPLIKFYIIGPTEAIRVRDLSGVALALLGGGMMVTLIIIQLILLKDGNARQQVALASLSKAIDKSLTRELQRAFAQLQAIDQQMAADKDHWRPPVRGASGVGGYPAGVRRATSVGGDPVRGSQGAGRAEGAEENYDVSDSLVAFMKKQDTGYFSFDRVNWVDSLGAQVVSASLDTSLTDLHVDVANRPYFKDFTNNSCYRLPGNDTSMVSLQAVVTWTDGDFRVVLARRSSCPGMRIVTLSTHLYSVNNVVLPSGFGFCVIDRSGLVQMHSEPSRNLVENFIEQSGEPDQLRAAMTGRQRLYLETTSLYGKEYGLHLAPVAAVPFYLAVFYDKGYILPMNMRILVFALLGCAVTMLICMLFWLLLTKRGRIARPLLFSPMDYLNRLRPDNRRTSAYVNGVVLIVGVAIGVTAVAVMNPYVRWVNQWVLLGLLFMPPLVMAALWIIISNAGPVTNSSPAMLQRIYSSRRYVIGYSILLEGLVICLGVTPAALFTWHAQNQEILQYVKREQLLKADQLTDRRQALYLPLLHLNPALSREDLYNRWMDSGGIYNIYGERLFHTTTDSFVAAQSFVFERNYFDLAQRFGDINYDPSYVPVLLNHSADYHWKWMKLGPGDTLPFAFVREPDVHQAGVGIGGRTAGLKPPVQTVILSKLPARYPYLGFFWKSVALIAFVSVLLFGLFRLIRHIVQEVFLVRWTHERRGSVEGEAPVEIPRSGEYATREEKQEGEKDVDLVRLGMVLNHIARDIPLLVRMGDRDQAERDLIRAAQSGGPYFHWLYTKQLLPREQWLLYHFARYGLLNYKNVFEIDHLLDMKVLTIRDGQVQWFSPVFRAYILMNWRQDQLPQEVVGKSPWQRFRIPFLVLITVVAAFLFLTQQEAWQRLMALLSALSGALGVVRGMLKGEGDVKT
jgi:hypothetical protein